MRCVQCKTAPSRTYPVSHALVPPKGTSHAPEHLPDDDAVLGTGGGEVLNYAIVEDEVVVADPISMRTIDVVRCGA